MNGQLISFQGRDITGKNEAKYLPCAKADEVIPHKQVLYGWDAIPHNQKSCIVVEGVFSVWRMGIGTLATFGASYFPSQVRLLAWRFDKIFIMFDGDMAGRRDGEKLGTELSAMGKEVQILDMPNELDPSDLSQQLADKIRKEYLG